MKNRRGIFFLAGIAGLFLCRSLFAWTESDYDRYDYEEFSRLPAARRRIDMGNIDYPLLNAAVFYETNRARAAQGKKPFRHSSLLERAAAGHSRDMAARNFMSHLSPVAGKRTPGDRMEREGLSTRNGAAGENLSIVFGIEYESGKKVFPPRDGRPFFSYEPFGKPIQNHTYLGLAQAVLNGWMHSRLHRQNILDARFQYLGTGAAHYTDPSFFNIDTFKLTQNFFGPLGTKNK